MAPVKKSVVMIYAAGSLRHVLHGPAGLLRERIEAGERPDISCRPISRIQLALPN